MANENLKAKLAEYEAACEKVCAKFPERKNLKYNRVYTPLDIDGFDYEKDRRISIYSWRTAYDVSRSLLDDAYVRRLCYC